MGYPNLGEYLDALQLDRGVALADPALRNGSLGLHAPGRPIVHGGTFAFTFEIATGAGKFALRCFHRELDELERRYRAIRRHLESNKGPYFVDFDYQPRGIRTEGGEYPVVRMDWVEGQTLAAYVAQHRDNAQVLHRLRQSLRQLARHLLESDIGHGDIQPSNIIVQDGGNLRLIDYDGMFVPELSPLLSAELGQRNFQHPDRRAYHFDPSLDAFAFMVLDLALQALCLRPDLWELTASREDAFLLRAADYADPASSPTFALLAREGGLEQRTRDLAAICVSPFESIPTFEDFLSGCNMPEVTVQLRGGDGAFGRRGYLSPSRVLHAADFAECCRHIGDRVELIGPVVSVSQGEVATDGRPCLRIEFDHRPRDRTCLNLWPDTVSRLDSVPDESWIGRWVSAVGLVEPVVRDETDRRYQKHLPISITEPCQLQVLEEAEARYRLQALGELTDRSRDRAGSVRTDPVTMQAASPALPALKPVVPHSEQSHAAAPVTQVTLPPAQRYSIQQPKRAMPSPARRDSVCPATPVDPARRSSRSWSWLLVAAGVASVALIARFLVSSEPNRTTLAESPTVERAAAVPSVPVAGDVSTRPGAESTPPGAPEQDRGQAAEETPDAGLRSQKALKKTNGQVATAAGILTVSAGPDGRCRRVVALNGEAIDGLCDDVLVLRHHAVFGDREVVVGFARCSDSVATCDLDRPFWLELRAGSPPVLRQARDLWAGSGGNAIAASDAGVQVSLGTWNGERRRATLTPSGNVVVARAPVPVQPLGRRDCADVAQALEACAASRDCSSFARSARPIPASQWSRLARMYHESTGLDVAAFRALCVRSCELGLTPSAGLIQRYACSGAERGQWPADNPARGLER